MKILLIEDDRELADSMRFQLEKEGYETDICDDGEEGYCSHTSIPRGVLA